MLKSSGTHPYLAASVFPHPGASRGFGLCLGFSLFMALMAQVSIALPFTPVPITGQTLAVLLTGAVLGPRLGFWTLVLYLAEGMAGLPVFAGGTAGPIVFAGPTAGYLVAFPLTAGLVGWLAVRGWDRRPLWTALAMLAGEAVIFGLGLAWLGAWLALAGKLATAATVLSLGLLPFLPGEALKVLLAMGLLPSAWKLVGAFRQG